MSYTYTYEKTFEGGLVPNGEYEARIERIEKKTTDSGREKLSLMYRIRDDIEGQSYGNKCLFEDIWTEKENPQFYNRKRINQLLGTQDVEPGEVFETIDDVINFVSGKCIRIVVGTEFNDYRGEDVNKIRFYKSSKFKPAKLESKVEKDTSVDIDDDDLPF